MIDGSMGFYSDDYRPPDNCSSWNCSFLTCFAAQRLKHVHWVLRNMAPIYGIDCLGLGQLSDICDLLFLLSSLALYPTDLQIYLWLRPVNYWRLIESHFDAFYPIWPSANWHFHYHRHQSDISVLYVCMASPAMVCRWPNQVHPTVNFFTNHFDPIFHSLLPYLWRLESHVTRTVLGSNREVIAH